VRPRIGITLDLDDEFLEVRQEYAAAVINAGGMPVLLPPIWEEALNAAGFIDGLLLTGGADLPPEWYGEELSISPAIYKPVNPERIEFEKALLKEVMRRKLPVLGICLGMQLINVALGGSLYQDLTLREPKALDHRKGPHEIKIIRSFCAYYTLQYPLITVNSSHHQAVKTVGSGLEVFAMAQDGIVEGFCAKDYPFLVGVQWHPERSVEGGKVPNAPSGRWSAPRNCDKLSAALFDLFIKTCSDPVSGGERS